MHGSLILQENILPTNEPIIRIHGKEYFNFNDYTPEASGLYELLFSWDSQYIRLIEQRIFIPLFYYDKNESKWYHSNKPFDIKGSRAIGWCLG